MQFVQSLTTGVRNALSPESVLQDAVNSLEEVLNSLHTHSGIIPPVIVQTHVATYTRLNAEAQALSVNNSLTKAKALRKAVEEFHDQVRRDYANSQAEALAQRMS